MIEIGKTYKNYVEVCNVLGCVPKSGKSKKAHISQLQREYELKIDGRKFTFIKKREEKLEKLSSGLYTKDIQVLILHILCNQKQDGYVYTTTINNLMNVLDIVNDNYIRGYMNRKLISDKFNVEEEYVNEVYQILSRYKGVIMNSLKALNRKKLISLNIRKQISYNEAVYKTNNDGSIFRDVNGNATVIDYYEDFRQPTFEEEKLILEIEREEMLKLGIKDSLYFNFNPNIFTVWKKNTKERLKPYNINYMFEVVELVYNHANIERSLERSEEKKIRDRLNANVLESVLKTIKNNHNKKELTEKTKQLIECGLYTEDEVVELMGKSDFIKSTDKYIKQCTKTTNKVVDRNLRTRDKL